MTMTEKEQELGELAARKVALDAELKDVRKWIKRKVQSVDLPVCVHVEVDGERKAVMISPGQIAYNGLPKIEVFRCAE